MNQNEAFDIIEYPNGVNMKQDARKITKVHWWSKFTDRWWKKLLLWILLMAIIRIIFILFRVLGE